MATLTAIPEKHFVPLSSSTTGTNPIVSTSGPASEDINAKMDKIQTLATPPAPVGEVTANASLPAGFGSDATGKIFKLPAGSTSDISKPTPPVTSSETKTTPQTTTQDTTQNQPSGLADAFKTLNDQAQSEYDRINAQSDAALADVQSKLNQAINGTLPLNQDQQDAINNIQMQYQDLISQQKVSNENYTKAVTRAGISAGRNMYAPEVELGNINAAVTAGVQEITKLTNQMNSAVTSARIAYENQDYDELNKQYELLDKAKQDRLDAVDKMTAKLTSQIQAVQTDFYNQQQDLRAQQTADLAQKKFEFDKQQALNAPILAASEKAQDYLYNEMQKYPDAGITAQDTVASAVDKIKNSQTYKDAQAKVAQDAAQAQADLARTQAETRQAIASAAKAYSDISSTDLSAVQSWVSNINNNKAKLSDVPKNLKDAVSIGLSTSGGTQSEMLQTTKDSLDELNKMVDNNKGFTSAVGVKGFGNILQNFNGFLGIGKTVQPGSAAAGFVAKLNQVKNDVILPNLTVLHGLGRVTDREFQALTSSVTSLSADTSETDFKNELKNITDRIDAKIKETDSSAPKTVNVGGKILNVGQVYVNDQGKKGLVNADGTITPQ